jgi:hypothetical protein
MEGDAPSALERFSDTALLKDGVVSLIGLDAIAAALGDRWAGRREQVYEHVDRSLAKVVEPAGYHVRVSETDYLVVRPDLTRYGAQAAALSYLRELLQHFLGSAAPASVNIRQVTRLDGSLIEAEPVDIGTLAAEETEALESRLASAPLAERQVLFSEIRWNPFVASDGRTLTVSCVLEPLLEVRGFAQVGFRMRRRVVDPEGRALDRKALSSMASVDIERVDLATIARGISRAMAESGNRKQPTLMLPLSCVTMASQRGRMAVGAALEVAAGAVREGLIAEITDVDLAASGAVLAATTLLKPYCRVLVGGLSAPPVSAPAHLSQTGLHGLAFDGGEGPAALMPFKRWAQTRISTARKVAKSVVVYGLPTPSHAALAGLAGATHTSLGPKPAQAA